MKVFACRMDKKAWRALTMKGADALETRARSSERDVFTDERDDVHTLSDFSEGLFAEGGHGST